MAIVGAAMALATYWVWLVPMFQAPDEPTHFDYALTLYSTGGLLRADGRARVAYDDPYVHPATRYLVARTFTSTVRFHHYIYMPLDYGRIDYYRGLERAAPVVASNWRSEWLPWYWTAYPVGYYALVAAWMGLLGYFGVGVVGLFFGARLLSVALLGASLLLSYGIMRELRLREWRALLLTGIMGFFPLTTFVAAAVQPDNLSFALVSLSLYSALLARRGAGSARYRAYALLGVALGLLLITKYQFYLCLLLPILFMLGAGRFASRSRSRHWRLATALLFAPSALTALVQLYILWGPALVATYLNQSGMHDPSSQRGPLPAGPLPLLRYVAGAAIAAFRNFYVDGQAATSFWGTFGWLDTPLVFGSPDTDALVKVLVKGLSITLVALASAQIVRSCTRLVALVRRGHGRSALRLACANPAVNSYFAFTALMFAVAIYNQNFGLQGRYWLPLLLPAMLLSAVYAPRACGRGRAWRVCSAAIAGLLVLYAAFGSYYAVRSVSWRYYGSGRAIAPLGGAHPRPGPARAPYALEYVNSTIFSWTPRYNDTRVFAKAPPRAPIEIPANGALAVGGWAAEASAVFVTVDGERDFQAAYGGARPDVVRARHDPAALHTGFDVLIPVDRLAPGPHWLTLKIVSADRRTYFEMPEQIRFQVLAPTSASR